MKFITHIRNKTLFIGSLILILLSIGCGSFFGLDSSADLPCPIPTEMMGTRGEDFIAFTFDNQSCTTICDLSISPSSCDDYGFNWLRDRTIPSGSQATFYLPPGKYDLWIEDCTEESYIMEKLKLTEDQVASLTEGDEDSAVVCANSLTVINHSDIPICHMWIAAPWSESFGWNWLGTGQIGVGESRTFVVPEGVYDLKAEGCGFEFLKVELDIEIKDSFEWVVP